MKSWHILALLVLVAVIIAFIWMRQSGLNAASSGDSAAPPAPATPTVADAPLTRRGPPNIYPRIDLNPGLANPEITQDSIADTICNKDWKTSSIRPPSSYTTRLKIAQITQYGFTDTDTSDYEEDHIISLENGGDPRDPRNLYPEAYDTEVNGSRIGAREKDKVENYIHNSICRDIPNARFSAGPKPPHALTLEQGQQILATDWYKCYLRMKQREDCVP